MTPVFLEKRALRLVLDTFGQRCQTEAARQRDDGTDDRCIIGIFIHITHERTIDFQFMRRKRLQISQRRIARAEIVDRNADAALLECMQNIDRLFGISQPTVSRIVAQHRTACPQAKGAAA